MRYTRTFEFKKTEEEAKAFCKEWDAKLTPYARKRYPSHYTPWEAQDGSFKGFVCFVVW